MDLSNSINQLLETRSTYENMSYAQIPRCLQMYSIIALTFRLTGVRSIRKESQNASSRCRKDCKSRNGAKQLTHRPHHHSVILKDVQDALWLQQTGISYQTVISFVQYFFKKPSSATLPSRLQLESLRSPESNSSDGSLLTCAKVVNHLLATFIKNKIARDPLQHLLGYPRPKTSQDFPLKCSQREGSWLWTLVQWNRLEKAVYQGPQPVYPS